MTKAANLIRELSEEEAPRCVNLGSDQQCVTGCMVREEGIVPQGAPCPHLDSFTVCPCYQASRPYRKPWEGKTKKGP